MTVDAVKANLRALFEKFDVEDLPPEPQTGTPRRTRLLERRDHTPRADLTNTIDDRVCPRAGGVRTDQRGQHVARKRGSTL